MTLDGYGYQTLQQFIGQELGVSEWLTIDQDRINRFADCTEDHQWIHVDTERAKRESPWGSTVAHGDLTLSMLPALLFRMGLQMAYHGKTILAEIRQRGIQVRVLVLTASIDSVSIQTALEYDAAGFALKTDLPMQTIEAIRQVAQGRLSFPRAAQRWLHSTQDDMDDRSSVLSPREIEMLAYVAKGYTNPAIASALSISVNTVRFHLKSIFTKLAVTNRTEAAAWYLNRAPQPIEQPGDNLLSIAHQPNFR